jgi:hypothetical protein
MNILSSICLFILPILLGATFYGFLPLQVDLLGLTFNALAPFFGLRGPGTFSGFFLLAIPVSLIMLGMQILLFLLTVSLHAMITLYLLKSMLKPHQMTDRQIFYVLVLWVFASFLFSFVFQVYAQNYDFIFLQYYSFSLPVAVLLSASFIPIWIRHGRYRQANV